MTNDDPLRKSVHTGLYTKKAYFIMKGMLQQEANRHPSLVRHRGSFIADLPLGQIHTFTVDCIKDNYVRLADDGEIYFTVFMSGVKWNQLKMENIVSAIWTWASFYELKMEKEEAAQHRAEVEMVVKGITKSLTKDDEQDPLYKEVIGYPLNPFKVAQLKANAKKLIDVVEELRKNDLTKMVGMPLAFYPILYKNVNRYVTETVEKLFEDYVNVLVS